MLRHARFRDAAIRHAIVSITPLLARRYAAVLRHYFAVTRCRYAAMMIFAADCRLPLCRFFAATMRRR